MNKPAVRLICYAWGQAYVDRLLSYAAAATLAPGNLPALARVFDCTFVILTERRLFDYVRAHPIARHIERICPLKLLPLDDLIAEPWQYGLSVAYSLFRGVTDLGPEATNTYCLFLNADFVLADGCYETLIPRIVDGEHLHLSPSYCVAEEQILPSMEARRDASTGALAIGKRDMAALVLKHRHNTIRAKTVNQGLFHFKYMDQFYWHVDEQTLIGHQMPIAVVGMRPEVVPPDLTAFWDWGVVYDLCPSKRLTVLGNSDEFVMLELRSERTHMDLIRVGNDSAGAMASRMTGYITQYQVDNAKFPLTLHSADLPSDLGAARVHLRTVVDEVLSHLPSKPIDHVDHAQWRYHKAHFEAYRTADDIRANIKELKAAIDSLEAEQARRIAEREREALRFVSVRRGAADGAGASDAFTSDLVKGQIAKLHLQIKEYQAQLQLRVKLLLRLRDGDQPSLPQPQSWKRRLYSRVVGSFPTLRVWHPLYDGHASLIEYKPERFEEPESWLVVIGNAHDQVSKIAGRFGATHALVTAVELEKFTPALHRESDKFSGCAILLSGTDRVRLAPVLSAVTPLLRHGSRVFVHWMNSGAETRESWELDIVNVVANGMPHMTVRYGGSRISNTAIRFYNRARAFGRRISTIQAPLFAVSLTLAMIFAAMAHVRRGFGRRPGAIPRQCSSVAIEFEHDATRLAAAPAQARPTADLPPVGDVADSDGAADLDGAAGSDDVAGPEAEAPRRVSA